MQDVARTITELKQSVDRLAARAQLLDLPDRDQAEWYQLITQKLLPQLNDSSYLVVAVVGGTNIGKSVIFNHLCGGKVSATSPLASGTKHPTCLVPSRLAKPELLQTVFSEFELQHSDNADDALKLTERDILFWREQEEGPENLLLLDTPDIDSDAEINWNRADKVRRAADVLIAVLTQQKYNDAAVKKFFRTAAAEDKAILVVFNQCLLPDDDAYWPVWLETFCQETGVSPEFVYVAPHDRRAAEENRLLFYHRNWPVNSNSPSMNDRPEVEQSARDLMQDISTLRFEEIKLRSLRGAIASLQDSQAGIPRYLSEIRQRAGVHGDAWNRLTERLREINVSWPNIPNRVVIAEIRRWWKEQRTGWEASVHSFYDAVGKGIMWPVRKLRGIDADDSTSWVDEYRMQEWSIVQQQLFDIYDRLDSLSQHGNPVLAPRLNLLLSGNSREETIEKIRQAHRDIDFDQELEILIQKQMTTFRDERDDWYRLLKRLDSVAAAARPVLSVALFATGFGPVGHAVVPVMTDAAMQTALHVAGDATAGAVTAAVGETAISSGASTGVRYLEAWFHQLHRAFVESRKNWMLDQLQQHLWGTLLEELQNAAETPQSKEYLDLEQKLTQFEILKSRLSDST